MCGRFVIADDKDIAEIKAILAEIDRKYNGTGLSAKTGEIFPTDTVPTLALAGIKPELSLMQWGFPRYGSKSVIINARAETAGEKGMFAKHLRERRCVIPSTGFFEWRHGDGRPTKDKFRFNTPGEPMLYMAGIFSSTNDTCKVDLRERFVIITRAANDSVRDIHHRMPVILYKHELVQWLRDDKFVPYVFGREDVRLEKLAV